MNAVKAICWVGQIGIASVLWFEYGVWAWLCGFTSAVLAGAYTAIKFRDAV